MKPLLVTRFILLWGFVLSAGCQTNPVDTRTPLEITSSPAPVSPAQGDAMQMTQSLLTPTNSALQSLIDKAIADLAQRLSIPAAQISLVDAISIVWPDSSLGCPQPGTVYTQISTSGSLIHLEAGGKVYEYHGDFNEQIILCEIPETIIATVKPGDIQDGKPWMPP